nr:RecName: Full=Pathogenesis-related protein; Short=PRP; AltName: Allergen=Foe v 1 [Anethum foeniculum]
GVQKSEVVITSA